MEKNPDIRITHCQDYSSIISKTKSHLLIALKAKLETLDLHSVTSKGDGKGGVTGPLALHARGGEREAEVQFRLVEFK